MEGLIEDKNEENMNNIFKNEKCLNCETNSIMIQLKFFDSIHLLPNYYKTKTLRFKICLFDVNDCHPINRTDEDKYDSNSIEISVMNEKECYFTEQEPNGRIYNPMDYILFRYKVTQIDKIAFVIDLYSSETEIDCKRIGFCYIFVSNLKETAGIYSMPFTGDNGKPIAHLNIEYLIINQIMNARKELNQLSSTNSWRGKTYGYDVGHRGAGIARRTDRVENILENTIASFNFASLHGADMVELDVQLSKDKIPVIYHDFNVNIVIKSKNSAQEHETHQIPVKELTLKQLQILELSPIIKENKSKYHFVYTDKEENQPFATLQKVLECVDHKCGINVEIKYPQQKICGSWEAEKPFELNEYVDIILETLFLYSGSRHIMLSCFHPDICSMLKFKQNKYPVLFLTQGMTKKWKQFKDRRNSSIEMATYFALSMDLDGINVHAEDIIENRSLIKFVKSKNLVLFCWGEDLNRKELISELKKEGVDGVIYDKIDVLSEKAGLVNMNDSSTSNSPQIID